MKRHSTHNNNEAEIKIHEKSKTKKAKGKTKERQGERKCVCVWDLSNTELSRSNVSGDAKLISSNNNQHPSFNALMSEPSANQNAKLDLTWTCRSKWCNEDANVCHSRCNWTSKFGLVLSILRRATFLDELDWCTSSCVGLDCDDDEEEEEARTSEDKDEEDEDNDEESWTKSRDYSGKKQKSTISWAAAETRSINRDRQAHKFPHFIIFHSKIFHDKNIHSHTSAFFSHMWKLQMKSLQKIR